MHKKPCHIITHFFPNFCNDFLGFHASNMIASTKFDHELFLKVCDLPTKIKITHCASTKMPNFLHYRTKNEELMSNMRSDVKSRFLLSFWCAVVKLIFKYVESKEKMLDEFNVSSCWFTLVFTFLNLLFIYFVYSMSQYSDSFHISVTTT